MNPGWRIVDCTALNGSLKYSRGQLVVTTPSSTVALPLTQLAVILVGMNTTISGATLAKLGEYDIAVLVCDWRNIPVAGAYPWKGHTRIGARHLAQANLAQPKRKQAWKALIKSKVCGQARAAYAITGKPQHELTNLITTVKSGDSTNVETHAARIYWSEITADFPFRRLPGQGIDPYNSALDYGYSILRGIGIRAVTSAGLNGTLGVFHRGRSNMFSLVDDLVEPFRPMVDQIVFTQIDLAQHLDKPAKHTLVETLTTAPFSAEGKTVPTVFEELAQEYGRYAEGYLDSLRPIPWEGNLVATQGK